MHQIKAILKTILGKSIVHKLRESKTFILLYYSLMKNFFIDAILYYKHSIVFKKNTINKAEALIILGYHSLEKGLLHDPIRYRFGIEHVKILIQSLNKQEILNIRNTSQIASCNLVLCSYYEKHKENNIDISDYFPESAYNQLKFHLKINSKSVINHEIDTYFENTGKDFFHFSNSRCSVRDFTGESVPFEIINKVIELARNAPSVCNRQSVRIYYINKKETINEIFKIQGGLAGFDERIAQLLIVAADRNYFYSIGERNQMYIDGGIFLLNLLYALHFYKIAACPAHWGMTYDKDIKINAILNMPESEKVISLVPIGIPVKCFKTTLSLRRSPDEILKIV